MNHYASLDQLRRTLGLGAGETRDDDQLLRLLGAASRLIERHTGRVFYPRQAVRVYSYTNPTALLLGDDLLALDGLTNGDGAAISLGAAHLHPPNEGVRSCIVLDRSQARFTYQSDPVDALAVSGVWGYHPAWASAWAASGDSVQDAALGATETTLTVSDADGALPGGASPRFSAGQLIRIDTEYLHVRAVDAGTNELTVVRGANGTAASAHAQSTGIDLYQPPEDVQQACLRVAAWLYKQRDAGFVQAAGALRGQIVVPPALPEDVIQILGPLVRVRVA